MNNDQDMEKLKLTESHIVEWLAGNEQAQQLVPFAQRTLDFLRWQIDALSARPDEALDIPTPDLSDSIDRQSRFIKDALPTMPEFNLSEASSASGMQVIANTVVYWMVTRTGDIPTPGAQSYSRLYARKYEELQGTYEPVGEIRKLLARVPNSLTLRRLDPALRSFSRWKAKTFPRTGAATDIRNLLYGLNGDLRHLAYGKRKCNKTWQAVGAKIAKGGLNSPEYDSLVQQERHYCDLIDRLSDIVKDREGGSLTDLEVLWTETVDHVYIVLNLISV